MGAQKGRIWGSSSPTSKLYNPCFLHTQFDYSTSSDPCLWFIKQSIDGSHEMAMEGGMTNKPMVDHDANEEVKNDVLETINRLVHDDDEKAKVGLLYDETSLQTVLDLTRDWTKEERQMLRNKVTKMGLKTPFRDGLLKHVAEDILQLAKDGLQRRGFKETGFLNEVSEVVRT
ncbi:hypothetical protein KI387_042161, partial [Taxus chinensis]